MIDAHHHLWQLSRGDYPWPDESVAPIFRDFLTGDFDALPDAAGIARTVLVQATDTIAETEFLLGLAAGWGKVAAVVGWVDLAAPDAIETITRLAQNPLLKSLRPMLQNIDDTDWILRPEVQPALAHMAKTGMRFDALIQPRHLPNIARLAQLYPNLRIVIDHIAKPAMGGGRQPDAAWSDGIRNAAAMPNVWCKLSGMITEIGPEWQLADLQPFAALVLEAFGPERVMWGSDWPVVNLAGDYRRWIEATPALLRHMPQSDQDRIFSGSAAAFYGLD